MAPGPHLSHPSRLNSDTTMPLRPITFQSMDFRSVASVLGSSLSIRRKGFHLLRSSRASQTRGTHLLLFSRSMLYVTYYYILHACRPILIQVRNVWLAVDRFFYDDLTIIHVSLDYDTRTSRVTFRSIDFQSMPTRIRFHSMNCDKRTLSIMLNSSDSDKSISPVTLQ